MNTRHLQKAKHTKNSNHAPTLNTIQMIEGILADKKEFNSRNKLSRSLPKQVQSQTIEAVLQYLEKSNKVMRDKTGAILWIFADNNPKLMKLHKISTEFK